MTAVSLTAVSPTPVSPIPAPAPPVAVESPPGAVCREAYDVLHPSVSTLGVTAYSSGGMAGSGSGATAWATAYDPVASATLHAVAEITTGYGVTAALLDGTWGLYAAADCGVFRATSLFAPAPPALPPLELLHIASAPSALGTGRQLHFPWPYSMLIGALADLVHWPTADPNELRRMASAWSDVADRLETAAPIAAQAIQTLGGYAAPGLDRALHTVERLQTSLIAAIHSCRALSTACTTYAARADTLADTLLGLAKDLVWQVGLTSLGGAIMTGLTGPLGAEGSVSGEATLVMAKARAMVTTILGADREVALAGETLATEADLPALKAVPDLSRARISTSAEDEIAAAARTPEVAEVETPTPLPRRGDLTISLKGSPERAALDLDSMVATTLRDGAPIRASWGNWRSLSYHVQKHGGDFGARADTEYVRHATAFFRHAIADRLPTKVAADGSIRFYDETTNTFGALNPNGTIKTIFKPHSGPSYWSRQGGEILR